MPAFKSVFNEDETAAVLAYLRTLQSAPQTVSVAGDAGKGLTLFFGPARCAECHAVHNKGGFMAADLSDYGKMHSADDLRQQILLHKENERYGWTKVITRSGKEYIGLARNDDNSSLQLQTPDGNFLFFEKAQVAKTEFYPSAELNDKDLDNLIAFLLRVESLR